VGFFTGLVAYTCSKALGDGGGAADAYNEILSRNVTNSSLGIEVFTRKSSPLVVYSTPTCKLSLNRHRTAIESSSLPKNGARLQAALFQPSGSCPE
jgi:hypothetical protein